MSSYLFVPTLVVTSVSIALYCSICFLSFSLAASVLSWAAPETRGMPCCAVVSSRPHFLPRHNMPATSLTLAIGEAADAQSVLQMLKTGDGGKC